jgi:putative transposase
LILSFRYRVYPNRAQSDALAAMLRDFCTLYNAGLQQRIEAFQRARTPLNYGMQAKELKAVRSVDDGLARWSFAAEQQVLRRLDKSFKAFFARVKRGDKPGFPRFRPSARYHAAEFRVGDGLTIRKSKRLGFVGVAGEIKIKWHRPLASNPKSAILTRQNGKWFVVFHVNVEVADLDRRSGEAVGIDLGLSSLVALSNGELIERPNWTKHTKKGLRSRQRALARCKRGSKRRAKMRTRLANYSAKVARKRSDFLHKLSGDINSRFAAIGIEDLNIKGLARGMLAKEVNDAAWAQLTAMLRYKAVKAGGALIEVDPRGTSQTCPECGKIKPKALNERRHRCECGCDLDRDVAAAMVVHFRAHGFWPGHGLQDSSGRVAA